MKSLFLVRHAKSSWDDAAQSDFDRPLNARGTRDAADMARRLLQRAGSIDAFVSSPAVRAKTTAIQFAQAFGKSATDIIYEQRLYLAPASFFETLITGMDNRFNSVAVFSHNPGITEFANTLTNAVKTDNIPTGGIFAVTAAVDSWKDFSAAKKDLLFYDYPKLGA